MFQAQQAHYALQKVSHELSKLPTQPPPASVENALREGRQPPVLVEPAPRDDQSELDKSPTQAPRHHGSPDTHGESSGLGVDRDGDPFDGKRLSVQNTPFSVASVETTGTSHAEVSEALAVNIYPHQSKSVVLVNHSAKPSESSSLDPHKPAATDIPTDIPVVKTTGVNGSAPVTPPQQFSMDDVDSPLRNPRAPPPPPVINFIPATPSGLTPATEKQKQLGNYYEMTEERPKRSLSLLRRALSRRATERRPSPARSLLTRTFSLSRNVRRRRDEWDDERPRLKRYSTADDMPADETRLHPFWRPAYAADDESSEEEYDEDEEDPDDRTYRYPPIDNRPSPPRRSLSVRIKRTFAILPLRDDRYSDYPATAHEGPERRTIRRTPSGNLRVMKLRRSMESLTRGPPVENARPFTAPEARPPLHQQQQRGSGGGPGRYTRLWRSLSLKARMSRNHDAIGNTSGVGGEGGAASATAGPGPGPGPGPVSGPKPASGFLPALGDRINLPRRLSERRRERRTQELRRMISAPREVRDGVGDVIRRESWRDRDAMYVLLQQREQRELREREQR
ncbi:df7f4226-2123-4eca-a07c-5da66508ceb7 [Thermothielavioides terrestris]|uniref:Df7f4226-2123-4eca-a07c-5da66508ceb7 n=1 Tax=Thermothielavioides terrestris TaxID=2587410 RepID=A0A3S4C5V1_9PEZI|nr:df7f4226-2123-4eca-a07c-5da66508ceb7 [Thermothielavioides terrestris]